LSINVELYAGPQGLAALAVLCLPVYFAGIIFALSFAEVSFNSEAFGSNLLGVVVGVLESISFWTGLRVLRWYRYYGTFFSAIALSRGESGSAVSGRPQPAQS
jgi:hypothetical protein